MRGNIVTKRRSGVIPPHELDALPRIKPMIDLYKDNWILIQDFERTEGKKVNLFNFRIKDNNLNQVVDSERFNRIFESQSYAFKIQASFGMVLYDIGKHIIYYYYTSDKNHVALDKIYLIRSAPDFIKFKNIVKKIDPASLIRENYHIILLRVTNIAFFVYKTNLPLHGFLCGCDLPHEVKSSHYLMNFTRFKEHCFFRCLAYHRLLHRTKSKKISFAEQERETRSLFLKFREKFGNKDVSLSIMKKMELLYKIKINIYTFDEDKNIKCIFNSLSNMPGPPLRLFWCSCSNPSHPYSHVSYIKNFVYFSNSFVCETCRIDFKRSQQLKTHYKRSIPCNIPTLEHFSGGIFNSGTNIWERLENKYNIYFDYPPMNDLFCVYDFEAVLKTTTIYKPKSRYTQQHIPVSFSVCSNVPTFTEPQCIIKNGTELEFINDFVKKLETISDAAYTILLKKYEDQLDIISKCCVNDSKILDEVYNYFRILPVISFNGKSYDIPIIRSYLFRCLKNPFVIKKGSSYLTIGTEKLRFLDITTFIAPNTSYRKFLEAFQIPIKKGFFPYRYLTSERVLNDTKLPAKEHFFNDLTGEPLSDENYVLCQKAWKDNKMKTFKDYLIYYNNLDTAPFVIAIQKMLDLFRLKNVALFQDAISLPGISQKLLFQNVADSFELPGNEHIHNLLTQTLTGGPSIIFTRFSYAGKSKIKPYDYASPLTAKRVVGYDANSLYLKAISLEMPTGLYIYRSLDTSKKYLENKGGVKYTKELQWLLILQKELGIEIQSSISPSGQKQIGNYQLDGYYYNKSKRIHCAFEFFGCWFHSHPPSVCKMKKFNYNENLFHDTMCRLNYLKQLPNFQVFCIWECQFDNFLSQPLNIQPSMTRGEYLNSILPKTIRTGCKLRVDKILEMILSGKIFGVIQCSVSVNPAFRKHYDQFPICFKNATISLSDLSGVMSTYAKENKIMTSPRHMLISSMFCEQGVFISPMIRWFLKENIKHNAQAISIYDIHSFIEYIPKTSFKPFCDAVTQDRIAGDENPSLKINAYIAKNLGNSAYGKMITQVQRHRKVFYTTDDKIYFKHVKSPLFDKASDLGGDLIEIIQRKKQITWKNPLHIASFVYGYAKLKMLEFYYDFIKKYLLDTHYEILQMDTDSLYLSLSETTLEKCVKPHLLAAFNEEKKHWLANESNIREPGLFKQEYSGIAYCGLNSKTYVCLGDQIKLGLKGVQKRLDYYNFQLFEDVLFKKTPQHFENRGIRFLDNNIYTYTENKKGIDYFYCKRKVLDDGIHTTTLDV